MNSEDLFLVAVEFARLRGTTIINAGALVALASLLNPTIAGVNCYSQDATRREDMLTLANGLRPLREHNEELVDLVLRLKEFL